MAPPSSHPVALAADPDASAPTPARARAWGRYATALFLTVWAALLTAVGAVLLGGHWIALPVPDAQDAQLAAALDEVSPGRESRWELVHVLYAECRCSQRVFDYVIDRATPDEAQERVLLVGEHEEFTTAAAARAMPVVSVTQDELEERFGIESAPLLLVRDPDGVVRYAGGYTLRKQGLDYRDLAILDALRRGEPAAELPLYGCGVSADLQQALDPIRIQYGR